MSQQLRAVFALIVWMAVAQVSMSHAALAAASPESLRFGTSDRAELQGELTRSMTELQAWSDDVAPSRRPRNLELLRKLQEALEGAEGLTHTAWEVSRHPHRFYELLVCQRPAALDAHTTADGLLARLGEDIEACRHPSGLVLRRVWWSISAGSKSTRDLLPSPDAASIRGGVS